MRRQYVVRHLALLLVILLIYYVQEGWSKPPKYAPNYCLRFRFNCNAKEKKGHVCCLYPLPIDLVANEQAHRQPVRPLLQVRIRPIKLPTSSNPPVTDNVSINDNHSTPADRRQQASAILNKKNTSKENKDNKQTVTTVAVSRVRPRICQRLVVNCQNNPTHRCCQHEEEAVEESTEVEEIIEEKVTLTHSRVIPVEPNIVKVHPESVKGEAITVPLEHPAVKEEREKYEKIINDEGPIVPEEKPYERIPTECFTETFDCDMDPNFKCCPFLE